MKNKFLPVMAAVVMAGLPFSVSAAVENSGLQTAYAVTQPDGWIYYEDFGGRTEVPDYFDCTVKGFSRAEIEDGALRATVINGGNNDHIFFNYAFEQPLEGRIAVETRVKTDSLAFANLLFFFCETDNFYDTGSVIANLCAEGGYFKNNGGSGWTSCGIACETGEWHDVLMVLDTDAGVYQLNVDGKISYKNNFRKKVTSPETAIRYLRFGSQTAWADVSYKYIGVREATDGDFADEAVINYENGFDGASQTQELVCGKSEGGNFEFTSDGLLTLQTPSSGTVSVSKTFASALSGTVATEVRFANNSSASNTFANVLFLENSALSGTAANIVTLAVESGRLRYNVGGWKTVQYGGGDMYLIDNAWYVLKAVNDYDTQKTKLYISGEKYKNGAGEERALGEDVYLGEYAFRNTSAGNPDKLEFAIGTGKAGTKFTVDYFKVYSVK